MTNGWMVFSKGYLFSTCTNIKISFLFKSICMFKKTCVPIYYLVAERETRISSSHKQTNISSNRKGKGRWSKWKKNNTVTAMIFSLLPSKLSITTTNQRGGLKRGLERPLTNNNLSGCRNSNWNSVASATIRKEEADNNSLSELSLSLSRVLPYLEHNFHLDIQSLVSFVLVVTKWVIFWRNLA